MERQIGFKNTLILGYVLAVVGGFLVTVSSGESEHLFALFLMLSQFGICITVNTNTIATLNLFPSAVLASVFGFKNTLARFITVLAPFAAELPSPLPMVMFSITSMVCLLLTS